MTRFDDGYDRGTVVRLFFGHAVGGEEGRPFARKDVVVTATSDDAIVGHEASVSDKSRGSLRGDEDDDPTNDVRVYDRELTVRKASVVMKRDFGSVEDTDVVVRQDPTDTWGVDEEEAELIPDGGEVLPSGVTAEPTGEGDVSLMIPTSDAHAERRGIILSPDEARDTAADLFDAAGDEWEFEEGDVIREEHAKQAPGGVDLGKSEYRIKWCLRRTSDGKRCYHVEKEEGGTHLYTAKAVEGRYEVIDPDESRAFDGGSD